MLCVSESLSLHWHGDMMELVEVDNLTSAIELGYLYIQDSSVYWLYIYQEFYLGGELFLNGDSR